MIYGYRGLMIITREINMEMAADRANSEVNVYGAVGAVFLFLMVALLLGLSFNSPCKSNEKYLPTSDREQVAFVLQIVCVSTKDAIDWQALWFFSDGALDEQRIQERYDPTAGDLYGAISARDGRRYQFAWSARSFHLFRPPHRPAVLIKFAYGNFQFLAHLFIGGFLISSLPSFDLFKFKYLFWFRMLSIEW